MYRDEHGKIQFHSPFFYRVDTVQNHMEEWVHIAAQPEDFKALDVFVPEEKIEFERLAKIALNFILDATV